MLEFTLSNIDLIIGRNLKAARIKKGLTQRGLGRILDVSGQQIQQYEVGASPISAGKLLYLSRILSIPIGDFYGHAKDRLDIETCSMARVALEGAVAFAAIKERDVQRNLLSLMRTLH